MMNTGEWTNSYGQNAPAMVISGLLLVAALAVLGVAHAFSWPIAYGVGVLLLLAAGLLPYSLLVAKQWEKAVVLRFGRLRAIRGPGLFMIVPFVDNVAAWVDQRIQTTEFNAEQARSEEHTSELQSPA